MHALTGLFSGVSLGLSNATVTGLFFEHERGRYMGVYTISFITGGHLAPILGSYIDKSLTWRWCFYVPSIIAAGLLVLFILTVPETLYDRGHPDTAAKRGRLQETLMLYKARPEAKLRAIDFLRPLQVLVYPSTSLPLLYYSTTFGYGSILFILTSSNIFAKIYKYQPWQTGVLLGTPLTVGSILGEFFAGYLSDWIAERRAVARNGLRAPEDRLYAILPGALLTPLGIIVEGVCITRKTHLVGPAVGIALAQTGR